MDTDSSGGQRFRARWRRKAFGRALLASLGLLLLLLNMLLLTLLLFPNWVAYTSYRWLGRALLRDCAYVKGPLVQLVGDARAMIMWEACQDSQSARLRWSRRREELEVSGTTLVPLDNDREATTIFRAYIEDYRPGVNTYEIRQEQDAVSSTGRFQVKMPSIGGNEAFRLAIVGDNQSGYKKFNAMLPLIAEAEPDVFLHVGDMVQTPQKDFDWQVFLFDPLKYSGLSQMVPFIMTQGNHDVHSGQTAAYFPPSDRLDSRPVGHYYALTMGSARLIVLDANVEDQAQVDWLEQELKSAKSQSASFRIVSIHIPPYIEYWDARVWESGESRWPMHVRNKMVPLFERHAVDLVVSGHQHNYQRGSLNGVSYLITGGGGGSLDHERVEDYGMYEKTFIGHHFTLLDVSQHHIGVKMVQLNGQIGDAYTINKKRFR